VTWLYIASVKLTAPSCSGVIDARENFPKQNQGSGIAEAIRVRLLRRSIYDKKDSPRRHEEHEAGKQ
jgi:hypothetical protein